jgi:hypothetical protein
MIAGRVVWGIAKAILLGISGKSVTLYALFVSGVIDAIPGIILQLLLIPSIMHLINRKQKGDKNDKR